MALDREKFVELFGEYKEAEEAYRSFVDQFFTQTWNGEITKEATKMLTSEDLDKIQELREATDAARDTFETYIGQRS